MNSHFEKLFLDDCPLLDVRAPVEFRHGAFPTAVNIPLLNDDQRHKIGICYKQHGQQKAIELGLKLLTPEKREQRLNNWKTFVEKNPQGYLYCFRGGLRSRTTREWLAEANIDFPLIEGGYKAMRGYLLEQLDVYSTALPFVILGGRTGSGKTKILKHLPNHIDLEGLAAHRGSSFGALPEPQPSNIDFENALSIAMLKHHSKRSTNIFLEDEGRLIGRVCIPQQLRERMQKLPVVEVVETLEHRVSIAETDYIIDLLDRYTAMHGAEKGLIVFAEHHHNALHRIRKRFGNERVTKTLNHFNNAIAHYKKDQATSHFHPYIEALLTQYYDPMYDYQFANKKREILFSGSTKAVIDWATNSINIQQAS